MDAFDDKMFVIERTQNTNLQVANLSQQIDVLERRLSALSALLRSFKQRMDKLEDVNLQCMRDFAELQNK